MITPKASKSSNHRHIRGNIFPAHTNSIFLVGYSVNDALSKVSSLKLYYKVYIGRLGVDDRLF